MVKLVVSRFKAESDSSNRSYDVVKYDDGTWACSCPKWIFTKGHKTNCKHIDFMISTNAEHYKDEESTLTITGLSQNQANEVMDEVIKIQNKSNGVSV